jgi:hypothetical protein
MPGIVVISLREMMPLAEREGHHEAFAGNVASDTLIGCAGVAELADAPDSKSGARKGVEVQVLSPVLVFLIVFVCALTITWQESPKESLISATQDIGDRSLIAQNDTSRPLATGMEDR